MSDLYTPQFGRSNSGNGLNMLPMNGVGGAWNIAGTPSFPSSIPPISPNVSYNSGVSKNIGSSGMSSSGIRQPSPNRFVNITQVPQEINKPPKSIGGTPQVNSVDNFGPNSGSVDGPWSYSNTLQIQEADLKKLPLFNISEASSNSLGNAIQLLTKLGESWPHQYAVLYSASTQQNWLLSIKGTPCTMAPAIEAHNQFLAFKEPKKKERKVRDKNERQSFPLEQRLTQALIGQRGPIQAVSSQIRRKENGWHSSEHPLVFLFLGSSGIGKTELAKQVATYLHPDDKDAFIRIDMTEFQHQHEVSKFIGAPPGYLGHDEGGQLTKRLKNCPYAVVLFDEVEKAHPDILTCLLQTFDEGRLTDGKGETVECMDAIFVMTSNLLQKEIADEAIKARQKMMTEKGTDSAEVVEPIGEEFKKNVVFPILRQNFKRDEFIGRINEILYFLPFSEEQLLGLVRKELVKWQENAQRRHNIILSWDPEVESLLVKAYNIRYGARSLQHEVERKIVSRLAKAHELDQIGKGSNIRLSVADGEIKIYKQQAQQ